MVHSWSSARMNEVDNQNKRHSYTKKIALLDQTKYVPKHLTFKQVKYSIVLKTPHAIKIPQSTKNVLRTTDLLLLSSKAL